MSVSKTSHHRRPLAVNKRRKPPNHHATGQIARFGELSWIVDPIRRVLVFKSAEKGTLNDVNRDTDANLLTEQSVTVISIVSNTGNHFHTDT